MSRDNFRRELNSVFDEIAGPPSTTLRDRVRSSLEGAPERYGPYWIAAVAACLIAVLLVGVLFFANPLNRRTPSVGPGPLHTPMPTLSQSDFHCGVSYLGTTKSASVVVYVNDVKTGSHAGYDRLTITFSNGLPGGYELKPQGSANFTYGASGAPVTLQGTNGLLVIIRGADEHTSFNGSTDLKTGYKGLLEARQVEDFEGTVQWALGLSAPACYRASVLTNPDRLVIDIQTLS